jgi:diadenosine tetraphosphate (Ap4A) HIT family hydrolase
VTVDNTCPLCRESGGAVLFAAAKFRVVRVLARDDADALRYPGFCRVIWNEHVREMSDLTAEDRALFMAAVFRAEAALRQALRPLKINLASLGNMTPHLHWHVIPRYRDDATFPKPIWAALNPVPSHAQLATLASQQSAEAQDAGSPEWARAVTAAMTDPL